MVSNVGSFANADGEFWGMKSRQLLVSSPVDNLWITMATWWTKRVVLYGGKKVTFKVNDLPLNGGGYIEPPLTERVTVK